MSINGKKHLWIIDPEEEIRKTITRKINSTGYFDVKEIGSAPDVETILHRVAEYPPRVVLIDVNFPDIDTADLIKTLKDTLPHCSIIILSYFSDENRIKAAIQSGASFFACKEHLDYNLPGILDMIVEHETTDDYLVKKDRELHSIVETQKEMLCRFKPDTTLTFVNRSYAEKFGKKPKDLIGVKFLSLIPKKDHAFIKRFLKSYTPDNPIQTYRHPVLLADGSIGWQEYTDYAFFDAKGKIKEFQSVGRDITYEVQLSNALKKSEEKERLLISRELHDHIGQMLTYTKIRMEEGLLMPASETRENVFREVLDHIIESMQEVRMVSRRVVAGYVKDQEFHESLNNLVHSFKKISRIQVKFCSDYIPDNLNQEAKSNLYRIIQEAFTNIMKHAEAKEVSIGLFVRDKFLNLVIRDNGKGADVHSAKLKGGFITIKHRVEIFKGSFKINSKPGQFFKMQIQLPICNIFDN